MENLPKQIVNNTQPKKSFSIVVSDNKTRFKTGVKLPSYSPGANAPWFDIIIPEGSYHVEDINEFIHRPMRKNDHYDKAND